jgi:S-adenosylmethionine synthetase
MIHCAEAVLPGHPDKFCNRVADAIVTRKPLARTPAHIDRLASRAARHAAVRAVQTGALECTIGLAYAPNRNAPLQETWELERRGERQSNGFFHFDAMLARLPMGLALRDQGDGVFAWELP